MFNNFEGDLRVIVTGGQNTACRMMFICDANGPPVPHKRATGGQTVPNRDQNMALSVTATRGLATFSRAISGRLVSE